jgi:hypothetical protein
MNIAKGRVAEYNNRIDSNDPANSAFIVVLLKTVEADATLKDYDSLGAILAAGGGTANVEANFTNYARKTLTDADTSATTPDDTNDRMDIDVADFTWTTAGGATNNTLAKLLICYDPDTTSGTDSNIIPLTAHDFVATTDGTDLTAQIAASGFYRAA